MWMGKDMEGSATTLLCFFSKIFILVSFLKRKSAEKQLISAQDLAQPFWIIVFAFFFANLSHAYIFPEYLGRTSRYGTIQIFWSTWNCSCSFGNLDLTCLWYTWFLFDLQFRIPRNTFWSISCYLLGIWRQWYVSSDSCCAMKISCFIVNETDF